MNPKTFRTNLKTALDARAGMQNISAKVFQYPPGRQADRRHPTIWFAAISNVAQEDQTLLGDLAATYQIAGGGYAAGAGALDSQWANAESTAYTLINELNETLEADETVDGAAGHVRVTTWSMEPTVDDQGNVYFDIDFTLTAQIWP